MKQRIVSLIDMDCFYAQVEQRDRPELWDKPVVVVQYNDYRKGGIIAVSYEARAKGVKRHAGMRGEDAEAACPDVTLVSVPVSRGKACLTKYRDASAEVFAVLDGYATCDIIVERASVDEAFLDLTAAVDKQIEDAGSNIVELIPELEKLPSTYVIQHGHTDENNRLQHLEDWIAAIRNAYTADNSVDNLFVSDSVFNNLRLLIAASVVENIRSEVHAKTQFYCSAGIGHNKTLAKLTCALHKPRQQSILPMESVSILYETMPIKKVRNLGGKLGNRLCEHYGIEKMCELTAIPLDSLRSTFGEKTGHWLYLLGKGVDHEEVNVRNLAKSVACGKNFMGREMLRSKELIFYWLQVLSEELEERLQMEKVNNKRVAQSLTIGVRTHGEGPAPAGCTRATAMPGCSAQKISMVAFTALKEFNHAKDATSWDPPVINLSISASKFEDSAQLDAIPPITKFFKHTPSTDQTTMLPSMLPSTSADSGSHGADASSSACNNGNGTSAVCGDEISASEQIDSNLSSGGVESLAVVIINDDDNLRSLLCPESHATSEVISSGRSKLRVDSHGKLSKRRSLLLGHNKNPKAKAAKLNESRFSTIQSCWQKPSSDQNVVTIVDDPLSLQLPLANDSQLDEAGTSSDSIVHVSGAANECASSKPEKSKNDVHSYIVDISDDFMPEWNNVDKDVLRTLPASIRWELQHYYNDESKKSASTAAAADRKCKQRSARSNSVVTSPSLTNFFHSL